MEEQTGFAFRYAELVEGFSQLTKQKAGVLWEVGKRESTENESCVCVCVCRTMGLCEGEKMEGTIWTGTSVQPRRRCPRSGLVVR